MNLNELRDKAYQCAIAHGWHEEEHSDEHWLCLIISELMEAVQADRKNRHATNLDVINTFCENLKGGMFDEEHKDLYEMFVKDTVEDELADACIRIFDFAGLRNIEIADFIEEEIRDASESCNDETFTESIYAISTTSLGFEYEYDYQLKEQLNGMLLDIFGLAKHLNIDILWHIEQKISYNELRPYKHGKRY